MLFAIFVLSTMCSCTQVLPSSAFGISTAPIRSWSPSSPMIESPFRRPAYILPLRYRAASFTLFVKKKKISPAAAALEALEKLEIDEPLSKKEQLKRQQQQKGASKMAIKKDEFLSKALEGEVVLNGNHDAANDSVYHNTEVINFSKKEDSLAQATKPEAQSSDSSKASSIPTAKKLSKKEEMLLKALELEKLDAQRVSSQSEDQSSLSKKELKELKKKEEKLRAKLKAKMTKKQEKQQDEQLDVPVPVDNQEDDSMGIDDSDDGDDDDMIINENADNDDIDEDADHSGPTLEDKIRKERPPPRIRIMESTQPGYTSLRLEGVGIIFRNQQILNDATWGVQTGDRIGLVGANGSGKTTQLRILAGELEPTTGDVVKSSKDLRIAMLRQEFIDELVPHRSLRDEFLSVFAEENQILQSLREAETELTNTPPDDAETMQAILDRMQDLQNKADDKEVYVLESRVKKVMDVMGFNDEEGDDLVASFSGGWKMRIGLGKVLLKDPNILLLDEPTNHLDLDSVEWLEAFLREQNIPMVIVSHDREFLDQVCTKIVDAEGGICTEYDGNYSRFLELKKARMDTWQAAYDAQEKRLKEDRQWINKFKVKQPQAVKQRQAKLEKFMQSDEYVKKPPFIGKLFRFRFPDAPRLSPEVAEVKDMSHAYRTELTQNRLFDHVDLFIEKGDRIAVVGPNGSGKSTLLRLLVGRETPDEGTAEIVGQNVIMNYFEQNQADALDLEKTVLETIQGASNGQSYNELRALLGQFLFKGDSVDKKVRFLSGGEKARLSLCCMMLRPANLLILDEPTNHLDIPAKEMLEEALQHFVGSVMIVSHDRYFISKVATSIVAIEEKKLVKYQGDYKFYMDRSKVMKEKIEARYVGETRIESAPVIDLTELLLPKKKNFGGAKTASMVTRKNKGVKNVKRLLPK